MVYFALKSCPFTNIISYKIEKKKQQKEHPILTFGVVNDTPKIMTMYILF